MSDNLERRYRRVLRLLPRRYRKQWEDDMVAAFLDTWLTGDPEADAYITKAAGPSPAEVASVAGLAVRLYLGGAGNLRRYLPWGQAGRNAVLILILVRAVRGLDGLMYLAWIRRWIGWLPAPPASLPTVSAGGIWATVWYVVAYAWIVTFVTLVLGHCRTARTIAALTTVLDLIGLLHVQSAGLMPTEFGQWAFWVLLDLTPALALAVFYRDAAPAAQRPWLLALPAGYLLVYVPLLALQATGNYAWLPDLPGLCCMLVSIACLAHVPRAWSRRSGESGVWSLTLVLVAAVAATFRVISLGDYLADQHLIAVSFAELLILVVAAGLIAPDAARAQPAITAPAPYPRPV